jgi:AbrB family looped-hinge helix DNA binding protein
MRVEVSENGEIVIPKEVAEAAGFVPGEELEVTSADNTITAGRLYMRVRFEREGPFLFPVLCDSAETLTDDIVEATRQAIYEERMHRILHPDG